MAIVPAKPSTLENALKSVKPGDVIELDAGQYAGTFVTGVNGAPNAPITVRPMNGAEPDVVFTGAANSVAALVINRPYWKFQNLSLAPTAKSDNSKPTWIAIRSGGHHATLRNLTFDRPLDNIEDAKRWNDYGIVMEGSYARIEHTVFNGMTKGIHPKGACVGGTIIGNRFDRLYQSPIVAGTSFGVVRGLLICGNTFHSHIEDGIQWMPNYSATNVATDVSNLGTIVLENDLGPCGENALDLKGAALIVIQGNNMRHIAGSNDGPLAGWNLRAMASITRGANTETGFALIRNNRITESAAGIRQFPHWVVVHNEIHDNNWWPGGEHTTGYGIRQVAGHQGTVVKNNLVYGHSGGDLLLYDNTDASHNADQPGADGGPLTATREAGDGLVLALRDARYFTDWFGRKDIPPDQIFVGEAFAQVIGVDYDRHTVTIDRPLAWSKDTPVFWRNPRPSVGVVSPYEETGPTEPEPELPPIVVEPPPVEPEPVEPPAQEFLTVRGSPAAVAMLRAVLTTLGDLQIED